MPFRIALSGLNAASSHLNVTSNNIANVNSTGFKGSRAEFADLFAVSTGDISDTATGNGTRLQRVAQQFTQGNIDFTENNLDLAISGEGFFTLEGQEGRSYTRAGNFSVNNEGFVENNVGERLQIYPPSGDGSFNTGQLQDLQLVTGENAPQATSEIRAELNLPADAEEPTVAPFDPEDPLSFNNSRSVTIYDSLGNRHDATTYFVKTDQPNEWETHLYVGDDEIGGPDTLTFNSDGTLDTPADGQIDYPAFDPGNGADELEISLDYGDSTQFGGNFGVTQLSQDGFAVGRLTGFEVDDSGVASARFSNGQSEQMGKVALANFDNPQGLQKIGDTRWGETFAAGDVQLGEAGGSGFGDIQSGALEGSNVDLTEELVEMITAQRNFQANAQMISTADTVTQTIINIR
ncbi:flagellar hook protein FlgE [Natronospira proteinivora]|uniref:Flagellar hook protein FlgE n=1 Tax=Natronospira proteinivora TaxID=1807133 RepID=A0ABT1G5Q3_9GAMM|nr:flagellar hook protein FlgE [Natronospira proteinivora]MCP1726417.1 flagellar hook protein FlgE [Natronospira proteinivora]